MLVPTRAPADETVEEVVDLFNQFRNPLLRYVFALGLSLHDGEEVVQEMFLALFQHLKQGKPRTNLKGWLFRVAHNLALKLRARNGRKAQLHSESSTEEHFAPELNPEEELAGMQRRQLLLEAVAALTETDRCCLYLRAEGLRYRQIAEIVGISLGGVSLSLARSLNRLAETDGS